jgi:hypothetical protein
MRGVSFLPRVRPYPLLGLGRARPQPSILRGPLLEPALGTRAADTYRRALRTAGQPQVLPPYGREVEQAYGRARADMQEPVAVFGIRAKRKSSKKRRSSSRKRSGGKSKRKRSSRVVCKMATITTPSGKRVRRQVCRNARGQIVSSKKKKRSRSSRRK